jgi:hypothetical protein
MNKDRRINKLYYIFALCLSIIIAASPVTFAQGDDNTTVQPRDATEVKREIDAERVKQVKFHLNEYKKLHSDEKAAFLAPYVSSVKGKNSTNTLNETEVETLFNDTLENAYIFTMDENGFVYDKNGTVVNKLEVGPATKEKSNEVSIQSLNTGIFGNSSGAFIRQTTALGYKGIRTTLTLPAPANITPSDSTVVGYLYNGLDVYHESGTTLTTGFAVEAGLQYSTTTQSYTASIHPQGNVQDAIPEGTTVVPPRYMHSTSMVMNLIYDTTSSQYKFFVNGTNVNNVNQYIYFYYSQTLNATDLQDMVAKRVTALAKVGWTGTEIGDLTVSYSGAELTKIDGTTTNMTSSLLSTHTFNSSKIYGTADNVDSTGSVTKTPSTGSIASQTQVIHSH